MRINKAAFRQFLTEANWLIVTFYSSQQEIGTPQEIFQWRNGF